MRNVLLMFVLASLSTACVSVSKSILTHDYRMDPVARDEVYVFFAYDEICEHDRIAILAAEGDEDLTSEGQMIDRLREEAGKLGANAIVLNHVEEPGGGERVVAAATGDSAERRGQAVAIRCVDDLGRFGRR